MHMRSLYTFKYEASLFASVVPWRT